MEFQKWYIIKHHQGIGEQTATVGHQKSDFQIIPDSKKVSSFYIVSPDHQHGGNHKSGCDTFLNSSNTKSLIPKCSNFLFFCKSHIATIEPKFGQVKKMTH